MAYTYKLIYVYKISKEGPEFPDNFKISSLTFSFFYNNENHSIKYVTNKDPRDYLLRLDLGGAPFAPSSGSIFTVLGALFREVPFGTAEIFSETSLPIPLVLRPSSTFEVIDYLATIKACPEIMVWPTECENSLIPWRYKLPDSEDWVEMDALGTKDMGFDEELNNYLLKREAEK